MATVSEIMSVFHSVFLDDMQRRLTEAQEQRNVLYQMMLQEDKYLHGKWQVETDPNMRLPEGF